MFILKLKSFYFSKKKVEENENTFLLESSQTTPQFKKIIIWIFQLKFGYSQFIHYISMLFLFYQKYFHVKEIHLNKNIL